MNRIQQFWLGQVRAEYASAAISAEFSHWLCQLETPPELIKQALRIAQEEVEHAEICYQVMLATGIQTNINLEKDQLSFAKPYDDLRKNFLAALLQFYCFGETIAVPLFSAMRKQTSQAVACQAFDRILQDEPHHANFGWLTLAWAHETWPETEEWLHELLPKALSSIANEYQAPFYQQGEYNPPLLLEEKSWGLLSKREYADIFHKTCQQQYKQRLKYYKLTHHLTTFIDNTNH